MAGVPVGVMVTNWLVRNRLISRRRAHLITLGAMLGVSDALTLVDLADDGENPRAYVLSAMVGLPIGGYLGYRFTRMVCGVLPSRRVLPGSTAIRYLAGRKPSPVFRPDEDR